VLLTIKINDMEFKGTKGPWKYAHRVIDAEGNYATQVFSNNTVICDMHWAGEKIGNLTHSRRPENAKLIAAAPDLLEALINLLKATDDEGWNNNGKDWEEQVESRKAIKKATE